MSKVATGLPRKPIRVREKSDKKGRSGPRRLNPTYYPVRYSVSVSYEENRQSREISPTANGWRATAPALLWCPWRDVGGGSRGACPHESPRPAHRKYGVIFSTPGFSKARKALRPTGPGLLVSARGAGRSPLRRRAIP
jgi:hypothetical protein